MMSKKQWLSLLVLFVIYLLLGATMFYYIEGDLQEKAMEEAEQQLLQLNGILLNHSIDIQDVNDEDTVQFAQLIEQYCGKGLKNESVRAMGNHWDFYNSVFFVITVVSTIGYGNLSPSCDLSRILMIIYAIIGIPMNGILLATLGEYFSKTFLRVHHRYKTRRYDTRAGLITDIILYLIPGFVIFIFLPAAAFAYFEDWDYIVAVYYAFVTLTTIGFGDKVAGQSSANDDDELYWVYKTFLIIWIIFGLGYLVMLLGFVTRAMRSKKISRLEHKLADNIRNTQSKIWNSVIKDVTYLRRVVNEMYLLKLKPVYKDDEYIEYYPRQRSNSLPSIPISDRDSLTVPGVWRRRANSEALSGSIQRVFSDTDLGRINKDATFKANAIIQPVELLARFVNALGNAANPKSDDEDDEEEEDEYIEYKKPVQNGGIHGFTDEDILASEKWSGSGWTLGGDTIPVTGYKTQRGRAASEVHIPMRGAATIIADDDRSLPSNAEWTWSGGDASRKIHKLLRARQKSLNAVVSENPAYVEEKPKMKEKRFSRRESIMNLTSWIKNPFSASKTKERAKSIGNFLFPTRKRQQYIPESEQDDDIFALDQEQKNYLKRTIAGRNTIGQPQQFLSPRRNSESVSCMSNPESRSFLEETTMADFIRALRNVQNHMTLFHPDIDSDVKPETESNNSESIPSLFSLFNLPHGQQPPQPHPQPPTASQIRRFSVRLVPNSAIPPSFNKAPQRSSLRRASLAPSVALQARRSSLRPSPLTTTNASQQRRGSLLPVAPSTFTTASQARMRRSGSRQSIKQISNNSTTSSNATPANKSLHTQWMKLKFERQMSDPIMSQKRTANTLLENVVVNK